MQEARAKARQEKLASLRAGKAVGPKKSAEHKQLAKKFYGQVCFLNIFLWVASGQGQGGGEQERLPALS